MKTIVPPVAGLIAILLATTASAQITPAVSTTTAPLATMQQVAVVAPAKAESVLRSGTEIPLTVREQLTTKNKTLRVGYRFQLEVASNVISNGMVIIPAGTPAIGEVTQVRNKGMWGKSGYIGARVLSLRLGDRQVRITGTFDDKGVTGTGGVVAAIAFVPIAGFITTGTSANIPSGSNVKSFLDEDLAYQATPAVPQVIAVPAPASAAATATPPALIPVKAGSPTK